MSEESSAQLENEIDKGLNFIAEIESQLLVATSPTERARLSQELEYARHSPQTSGGSYTEGSVVNSGGINVFGSSASSINYSNSAVNAYWSRQRICPTPPPPPDFFGGRERELAELKARVKAGQPVAITAIQGMGGVGKTTLARKIANDLFYDEKIFRTVLWADLGREPNVYRLLANWASYADFGFTFSGESLEQLAHRVRSMLEDLIVEKCEECEGGRSLVILDDVGDADIQAARLMIEAAPAKSTVLITTRSQTVATRLKAQKLTLDRLSISEGVALLLTYFPKTDPHLLEDVNQQLGGHPLALTLAAKQALLSSNPVQALNRQLEQYRTGLPSGSAIATFKLTEEVNSLELVLSNSYNELTSNDQYHFRTLGVLVHDQSFDESILAALWEEDTEKVRVCCKQLRRLSLLELDSEKGGTWYHQHPLLQSYAHALLKSSSEYEEIRHRYEDYIIGLTLKFNQLPPEEWDQLTPYLPHIHAVGDSLVEQIASSTVDNDLLRRAVHFANNTSRYLLLRLEAQQLAWLEMGLNASRQLRDQQQEALFLNVLGLFYSTLGEKQKALRHFEQALVLLGAVQDRAGEAATLNNLGRIYADLGDNEKVLDYYQQTLPLARLVGDRTGEATTLNNLGAVYSALGEKTKALEYYEQALPLYRVVGDKRGEATTLNNIGGNYADLGAIGKALEYYEQALPLYRIVGDKSGEPGILSNIGSVYADRGEKAKALEYYEQALPLYRAFGDRSGEATTLNNIGDVYADLGEKAKALEYYEQALNMRQVVSDRGGEAVTSYNLGMVYYELGQLEEAVRWVSRCIEIEEQIRHPDLESDRATLAQLQAELAAV